MAENILRHDYLGQAFGLQDMVSGLIIPERRESSYGGTTGQVHSWIHSQRVIARICKVPEERSIIRCDIQHQAMFGFRMLGFDLPYELLAVSVPSPRNP